MRRVSAARAGGALRARRQLERDGRAGRGRGDAEAAAGGGVEEAAEGGLALPDLGADRGAARAGDGRKRPWHGGTVPRRVPTPVLTVRQR